MKKRNLFLTLGLSLTLGVGVAAGLGASRVEAKEVDAASAGDTLTFYVDVTKASWWSGDSATIELQTWNGTSDVRFTGEWISSTIYKVEDVDTTGWTGFKFVRHVGNNYYNFSTWNTNFNNRFFTHAGSDDSGNWEDKEPALYSVTLSVTFDSDVPDYADICVTGEFNGWKTERANVVMTRVNNTTFTYALNNVLADTYEYKVQAIYSSASEIDWSHQIDSDNQTLTITAADDGKTVSLGNRSYDFAKNMPQEKIAEGAAVQLTFATAVPSTVDIIFVGSLTSWGTSAARLEAGKMSANASRLVFTWLIPENTFAGDYEYKIVAMSKYGSASTVSYDYLVYGVLENNEVLTLDTSTLVYPLNALTTNLDYLGALGMAQGFLGAMAAQCADEDADNHAGVASIWSTWKSEYEGLSSEVRNAFKTSNDATIGSARGLYNHVMTRYSAYLTAWSDGPSASYSIIPQAANNDNTPIIILVAVTISAIAIASIFVIRRRKEQE